MRPDPVMPRWFRRVLMVLAVAVVAGWVFRYFGRPGGFRPSGEPVRRLTEGFGSFPGGLLGVSVALVALGLIGWWLLSALFWRKYFPTQSPPGRRKEGIAPSLFRRFFFCLESLPGAPFSKEDAASAFTATKER